MVANSASRLCCVTAPPNPPGRDETDASELTELFGACEVNREVTEDSEGLLPCVGVAGAEVELELYPEPNRRRVDENSRDGSRREDEYCDQDQCQIFFDGRTAM